MSKAKSGLVPWPDDLVLTPHLEQYAKDAGLDANEEWEAFHDSALANGRKYADWRAAFRTWCRNAKKWGGEKKPIGFGHPVIERIPPIRQITITQQDADEYERECLEQTPEQRRANVDKFKEIGAAIARKHGLR